MMAAPLTTGVFYSRTIQNETVGVLSTPPLTNKLPGFRPPEEALLSMPVFDPDDHVAQYSSLPSGRTYILRLI